MKANTESIQSAALSLPIVVGVDFMTNTGTPGAALGPNIVTALFVVGGVAVTNLAATKRALSREFPKIDDSKGYGL